MSVDIEDYGRFYIQKQTIADGDGNVHQLFDVGEISYATGNKRYKLSSEEGFTTRDEAIAWIRSQPD